MKKILFFCLAMAMIVSACGQSEADRKAYIATSDALKNSYFQTKTAESTLPTLSPSNSETPTYRVFKSTGLYSDLDINADQIAELPVGTILEPAPGDEFWKCRSFVDSGMTFRLCRVKVRDTGKVGWVLQKRVEINY